MKHSDYTYQKLFRALYGYNQNICKGSGKVYKYHRQGVLSDIPFVRPGKNSVIIPKEAFSKLKDFFNTGKNPAHKWQVKGDWKAVYYMDEKKIPEQEIVKAMEDLVSRTFIEKGKEHTSLEEGLSNLVKQLKSNETPSEEHKTYVLQASKKIVSLPWFKDCCTLSNKLKNINQLHIELSNL